MSFSYSTQRIFSHILMVQQGILVSRDVAYCLLQECTKEKELEAARQVHFLMIGCGLDSIGVLGDHLIRLFGSCGSLLEANEAFCKVSKPSVYTWNAIISAHVMFREGERALDLYYKMQKNTAKPNKVTYSCILQACNNIGAIEQGRFIHNEIVTHRLELDVVVGNTLVDMYAKFESLNEAQLVFDSLPNRTVVSWGALIAGYVELENGHVALELFRKMQLDGLKPNKFIYSCALKGCGSIGAVGQGRLRHDEIINCGLESDVIVGSSLVDMYAKCASLEDAYKVFILLPNRNLVSWGAIMAGYGAYGHDLAILELFEEMQEEGIKPNRIIFSCLLQACGSEGLSGHEKGVHDLIIQNGIHIGLAIGSMLVDVYAKCGKLEEACRAFDELPIPNSVSWGALIAAFTQRGKCMLAWQCFQDMQQQGLQPTDLAFSSLLSACSRAGQWEEGCLYFNIMTERHNITASIEHYNCMVDLLGRTGHLRESVHLLQTMPVSPDIIGWLSLLASCRTYGNVKIGKQCFDQAFQLEPNHASGYVLMANIYADAHMWDDAERIQKSRKDGHALKKPGKAWIKINKKVHEIAVGCELHPCGTECHAKSNRLSSQIKKGGYVALLDLVLEPMSPED